jgi:hypothetical protein
MTTQTITVSVIKLDEDTTKEEFLAMEGKAYCLIAMGAHGERTREVYLKKAQDKFNLIKGDKQ